MYLSTINDFEDFLKSREYAQSTISTYLRFIKNLDEPSNSSNPDLLLDYIENELNDNRSNLTIGQFRNLQSSLNLFFNMKTGLTIYDYRNMSNSNIMYDDFLEKFKEYCKDYLHLTDVVVQASIREIKLFLQSVASDPFTINWLDVTPLEIISFLKTERSNLSTSSLGVTVTAIRRFFRFLQQCDYPINEAILCVPLSVPNWSKNRKCPKILTKEEQLKISNYKYPKTPLGYRNQAILCCFTELGLRCNEVANLKLSDIKWSSGTILIRKTKNNINRELPMSVKLGEALETYVINARPKELGNHLFFKSESKPCEPASKENIRTVIRSLFKSTGIKGNGLGTHTLRRTFGSELHNQGNSLKTIADLLGHNSIAATNAYVKVNVELLRTIADKWPRSTENE